MNAFTVFGYNYVVCISVDPVRENGHPSVETHDFEEGEQVRVGGLKSGLPHIPTLPSEH